MKLYLPVLFNSAKHMLFFILCWVASFSVYSQVKISVTPATCNGKEDGKIDVTLSGKNAPYQFLWSDGSTEDHLHNIPKGDYQLKITDKDGCIFEKSIHVDVLEDKPKVKIRGGGDKTFCEDEDIRDVTLSSEISRCAECELKWSTGSTSPEIQVSSDGDYTLTATDSSGCFASDSTELKIEIKDCDDDDGDEIDIPVVFPKDPNDIIGPDGVGRPRWVSVNDVLPYTIRFENDPEFATAPAQKVVIRTPLDPDLNIYSFRLSSFGFGSFVFNVPPNSTYYTQRLDVTDSLQVVVDVLAGIDVVKKEAFWIFESKDPQNGNEPDASLGFLLVNDSITHKGEGFVSFTIMPDPSSSTGDTIHAIADIVFDTEEAIVTPEIFNTIDALPPVSIQKYKEVLMDSTYYYLVNAQDDYGMGGSGVLSYDLYLSDDRGINYSLYASDIDLDSTIIIKGDPDKEYCAYTIARDSVGNKEWKSGRDTCFTVKGEPFIRLTELAAGLTICQGSELELEWESSGIDTLALFVSSDNGNSFSPMTVKIPARKKSFYWTVPYGLAPGLNYLVRMAAASDDAVSDTANTSFNIQEHVQVTIVSSAGQKVCEGNTTVLSAGNDYPAYQWSTGSTEKSITVSEANTYTLFATDGKGCSGKDSFKVHYNPWKPEISPAGPYKICQDRTLILSAPDGYSYLWSTGETSSSLTVETEGKIYVKVTDEYGCSSTSDTTFAAVATDETDCDPLSTNTGQVAMQGFVKVSPNPLTDIAVFEILLPQSQSISLKLYDAKGTLVTEVFKGKGKGGIVLPVRFKPSATLSNGMYVYKLFSENGEMYNDKLIIAR